MKRFIYDIPLINFLSIVADAMIVGLLWLMTSLVIVTIGASTTAAFYVMMRRISNREGSILKDYFTSFKSNFITSTLVFFTLVVLASIIIFNLYTFQINGNFDLLIYALQFLIAIELFFIYIHIFPLASRFDIGYVKLFKTSLIIANKHLFISLTHIAAMVAILWVSFNAPFIIMFAFGFYCWVSSHMLIMVYRKYYPQMDKDTDLQTDTEK